jgi:hypothetical protein
MNMLEKYQLAEILGGLIAIAGWARLSDTQFTRFHDKERCFGVALVCLAGVTTAK